MLKLVPDWRSAWRWFSVQAFAAIALLPMVWASLPADLKGYIPPGWGKYIVIGIALAGVIGRMIDQKKAPAP